MSRGNGGAAIYGVEDDRRRFLGRVSELPERFGTEFHALVPMRGGAPIHGRPLMESVDP